MAEIEIGPLSQRLADDEIAELLAKLDKHGAPKLVLGDEDNTHTVSDALDDDDEGVSKPRIVVPSRSFVFPRAQKRRACARPFAQQQ